MSTKPEIYVMVGVDLHEVISEGWMENLLDSIAGQALPGVGQFGYIDDVMAGDFTMAGKVLAHAKPFDGDELTMVPLSGSELTSMVDMVDAWLYDTHGIRAQSSLRVFTRYV